MQVENVVASDTQATTMRRSVKGQYTVLEFFAQCFHIVPSYLRFCSTKYKPASIIVTGVKQSAQWTYRGTVML